MADTIALMKQCVLDMAIRGELVDQQPEEGTAEELLNKIILKKERMIQDGNVKKPKDLQLEVENTNENEIPSSWKWVKLDDISIINRGASPRPIKSFITDDENGINWIKIGDSVRGRKYINSTSQKITKEGAEKSVHVSKGDLIMSNSMSFGYAYIMDIDGCIHDGWLPFKVPKEEVDVEWMHYLLNANYSNFEKLAVGTGVRNLNIDRVRSVYVGLPPISEQKRIVAKIEEIFTFIDQIGTKKEEALSIIRNLRQTALQDAIRGVLVDQEDIDEPASVLYEQIQADKERLIKLGEIKKEKRLSEIELEDIPFEIPERWKWLKLGNVISLISGRDLATNEFNYESKGLPYITGASNFNNGELVINRWVEDPKVISMLDDLLITVKGTVGEMLFQKEEQAHIARQVMAIRKVSKTNLKYIKYFLDAELTKLKDKAKSMIPGISREDILHFEFPMPPLAEQERIVDKLDEIMAICDQMEAIFDGTHEKNNALKVTE